MSETPGPSEAPDRPEKLKPNHRLVLSVFLNAEGRWYLDWNDFEYMTDSSHGQVDVIAGSDNPAAVVAELGNLIASALKDHIQPGKPS